MQARLGVTTVYVTHDQEEALALSDILAVVREGVIVEAGPPRQLYESPQHEFTARFLGSVNVLAARRLGRSDGGLVVETPLGRLTVAGEAAPEGTMVAGT